MDYHELLKSPELVKKDERDANEKADRIIADRTIRRQFLTSLGCQQILSTLNKEKQNLLNETIESASNTDFKELTLRSKLTEIQTITKVLNLIQNGTYAYGIDDSSFGTK